MLLRGGMDTVWKSGDSKIGEKSSDVAASSEEDRFSTAGCRDVTCTRRAYANHCRLGLLLLSILSRHSSALMGEGFQVPGVSSHLV